MGWPVRIVPLAHARRLTAVLGIEYAYSINMSVTTFSKYKISFLGTYPNDCTLDLFGVCFYNFYATVFHILHIYIVKSVPGEDTFKNLP